MVCMIRNSNLHIHGLTNYDDGKFSIPLHVTTNKCVYLYSRRQADGRTGGQTDKRRSKWSFNIFSALSQRTKNIFPKTTCKCEHRAIHVCQTRQNSISTYILLKKQFCTTWTIFNVFLTFCKLLGKLIMFIDKTLKVMSSDRNSDKTCFILFLLMLQSRDRVGGD